MPFSAEIPWEVHINSGGEKIADLRFPTDEELCDRNRRFRLKRTAVSRTDTKYETPNEDMVDAALFDKVKIGERDTSTYDEAEKSEFMTRMLRASVIDVERNGDGCHVDMQVGGGYKVHHQLRMPTQRQTHKYRRSTVLSTESRYGGETRVSIDYAGQLWDEVLISTEGYAGRVPVLHKFVAIQAIIDLMDREDDPDPER
jgi:hypothetical protein